MIVFIQARIHDPSPRTGIQWSHGMTHTVIDLETFSCYDFQFKECIPSRMDGQAAVFI